MTKKEKKLWLEAIDQLRQYYHSVCNKCLWTRFEGKNCLLYAEEKFGGDVLKLKWYRVPGWVKDSLKRLDRWEKLIREGK